MPELSARLPCPVCLGTTMDKVRVGPGRALELDVCRRCSGVWLEHGEVQRLRAHSAADLWEHLAAPGESFRMRCHDCHAHMERADAQCPSCGWTQQLDCPACEHPMRTETHAGLRLDLCRRCRGVWFDHHELEAVWGAGFDQALRKRHLSRPGVHGGDVLLETVFWAPELVFFGAHAAGHVVGASANALARLPEAIGAAPEAAGSVFEAVGEAAGSVFEVIVEIVGGIFDGL